MCQDTNLPAGLFTVVSCQNEYIIDIMDIHWFGKGGSIGSMSPTPWFLLLKMRYDDKTDRAEIFSLNFFSFIELWQNLCSVLM